MCLKCYGAATSGIVHLCAKFQTVKLGSASEECVASRILKTKMKQ